jgi:hypothetical protein
MKTYIKYIAIIAVAFGMNCLKKNIRFKTYRPNIYRLHSFTHSPVYDECMYNAAQIDSTTALTQTEEEDMWGAIVQQGDNRGEDVVNSPVSIN